MVPPSRAMPTDASEKGHRFAIDGAKLYLIGYIEVCHLAISTYCKKTRPLVGASPSFGEVAVSDAEERRPPAADAHSLVHRLNLRPPLARL